MEKQFIPYKSYGLEVTQNLLLSFFVMYPETYASNTHISERLGCSTKTISRTLKFLNDNKIVEVLNPKGRSRTIKLVDKYEEVVRQYVQHVGQSVQVTETLCPSKLDNVSHYNKEIKKNNKTYNKVSNKGIEPSSLLNELIKQITNETV